MANRLAALALLLATLCPAASGQQIDGPASPDADEVKTYSVRFDRVEGETAYVWWSASPGLSWIECADGSIHVDGPPGEHEVIAQILVGPSFDTARKLTARKTVLILGDSPPPGPGPEPGPPPGPGPDPEPDDGPPRVEGEIRVVLLYDRQTSGREVEAIAASPEVISRFTGSVRVWAYEVDTQAAQQAGYTRDVAAKVADQYGIDQPLPILVYFGPGPGHVYAEPATGVDGLIRTVVEMRGDRDGQ